MEFFAFDMCRAWNLHKWNYVPMPRNDKEDVPGRYCEMCGKVQYQENGIWKDLE